MQPCYFGKNPGAGLARAWCGPAIAQIISAKKYVNMFEGPVTGNIPEVLDNGEVTARTSPPGALTPYAQVTDLAVNRAVSGNNAAAIQSAELVFLHVFWAVPLNTKNGAEGHPPAFFLVFWAHSKAVSLGTKNGEEGHRALFLPFLLNFKSGVTLH